MTDLRAIAEAADAAGPGTWLIAVPGYDWRTAAHIVAWSPDRALAALAVIEAAQVMVDGGRRLAMLDLFDALDRREALA